MAGSGILGISIFRTLIVRRRRSVRVVRRGGLRMGRGWIRRIVGRIGSSLRIWGRVFFLLKRRRGWVYKVGLKKVGLEWMERHGVGMKYEGGKLHTCRFYFPFLFHVIILIFLFFSYFIFFSFFLRMSGVVRAGEMRSLIIISWLAGCR